MNLRGISKDIHLSFGGKTHANHLSIGGFHRGKYPQKNAITTIIHLCPRAITGWPGGFRARGPQARGREIHEVNQLSHEGIMWIIVVFPEGKGGLPGCSIWNLRNFVFFEDLFLCGFSHFLGILFLGIYFFEDLLFFSFFCFIHTCIFIYFLILRSCKNDPSFKSVSVLKSIPVKFLCAKLVFLHILPFPIKTFSSYLYRC